MGTEELNPNNSTTTWLVVVTIRSGFYVETFLNHLVKAAYNMEAFGIVKQMYPDKRVILECVISEKDNPALIRAIRFDQNAHHLPGNVLELIEPLQTGELMTAEEEAEPLSFRPEVSEHILNAGIGLNEKDFLDEFLQWCNSQHIVLASPVQNDIERGDVFPRIAPIQEFNEEIIVRYLKHVEEREVVN